MTFAAALAVAAALGATACRSDDGHGARTIDVIASAGTQPEPGAAVISHTASGAVVDRVEADAVGQASIGVDDDSLVTVVFPGEITQLTPIVSVVTTAAPPDGVTLEIHGPPHGGPPGLVVGSLHVDGANLSGAAYFDVDVGCATVRVTKLPADIDIGACSMGSDTKLDVLAQGFHDTGGDPPAPVLDGYAAGRAQMTDGLATLALPPWQTSGTPIPVTLDGVAPAINWTLYADGIPFVDGPIGASPFAYANLAVDATWIQAVLPGNVGTNGAPVTERFISGVPASIAFAQSDFLPGLDLSTRVTSTKPLAMEWDAAPPSIDTINLHVNFGGSTATIVPGSARVVWDVVLPPDATHASLPSLDDDLGVLLDTGTDVSGPDVVFREIDSSDVADFAALQLAGIHVEQNNALSTVVPRPGAGEVRWTSALGVQ